MKYLIQLLVLFSCLFLGALAGRSFAVKCIPCENNISDGGGPAGKFATNQCYMGTCEGAAQSWCYKETCSNCKWNAKKRTGCQAGSNYVCPLSGNCVSGKPQKHFVCKDICGC